MQGVAWPSETEFQFSFSKKSPVWSAILDDVVLSKNEIIAGSIFILPTPDALYCICLNRENARLHQLFQSGHGVE